MEQWGMKYFWKPWEMPKLRNVSIMTITNEIKNNCSMWGASLRSLDLHYYKIHWEDDDMDDFIEIALRFKRLEELSFTFHELKREPLALFNLSSQYTSASLRFLRFHYGENACNINPQRFFEFHDRLMALFDLSGLRWLEFGADSTDKTIPYLITQCVFPEFWGQDRLEGIDLAFSIYPHHTTLLFTPPVEGSPTRQLLVSMPSFKLQTKSEKRKIIRFERAFDGGEGLSRLLAEEEVAKSALGSSEWYKYLVEREVDSNSGTDEDSNENSNYS